MAAVVGIVSRQGLKIKYIIETNLIYKSKLALL